jgi:predicted AlkP superfamily pyrophosphatase or phosphodiesterase
MRIGFQLTFNTVSALYFYSKQMLISIFFIIFLVLVFFQQYSYGKSDLEGEQTKKEIITDPPAEHLILFSIDGLRPDFYLNDVWPAPTFQKMAREGTHAKGVAGIFPSVTFPSHTTLVTGALPSEHGIYYNRPFMPVNDTGEWYWYADSIKVETLWDVVHKSGGVTAGLNWPVTVGSTIDYNIADVWSLDSDEEPGAAVKTAQPSGFVEELERQVIGRRGAEQIRHIDNIKSIASYIIEEYKPQLFVIHIANTDAMQHRHGREHIEVRQAVAYADRLMTRMIESANLVEILDKTAFVVTGDHGFVDVNVRIHPNRWLVDEGLREESLGKNNWKATFILAGGSAFLRLRDSNNTELIDRIYEILDSLPKSTRQHFEILNKEQLEKYGSDPHAVLGLAAKDGVSFGGATAGKDIEAGSGGSHGHSPDIESMHTGFIAWGAGVRKGVSIPLMRMIDIGPTAANLIGFTLPDAVGGKHPGVLLQDN